MTVEDIVGEPLRLLGQDRTTRCARVVDVLEQVGMPFDAAQRYPLQFSGGPARTEMPTPCMTERRRCQHIWQVSMRTNLIFYIKASYTECDAKVRWARAAWRTVCRQLDGRRRQETA